MRDGRRGDTGRCEVYRGAAWNRKSWPRPPVEKSGRIRHNLVASMVHISRVYPSSGWGCCWFITCSSSSLSVGWCTQVQRASKRNGRVKRERITRRTVPSPLLTNGCVNIKIVRRFSRSISPSIYRWCAFAAAIHQIFTSFEGMVQDSMVRSTADSVFELRIDTRRHLRNFSSRIRYPSDAYHIWRIRISKHACQFWKLTVESRLCFCDYVIERIVTRILLFVASPTTYDNVIS